MSARGWLLGISVLASASIAKGLSLSEFLQQVQQNNQGVEASRVLKDSSHLRSEEGDLSFSPTLFANGQYISDGKPTVAPAFQGTKTTTYIGQVGIGKVFGFGLQAKLSQNLTSIKIDGATPGLVTNPAFIDSYPMLELTQPLWKNGFGKEFRTQSELVEANAEAMSLGEAYKRKAKLAEAESSYWRMVVAREALEISKDSLERSKKLLEWSRGRASLDLVDKSDLYQAQAAHKVRELELETAVNEERSASRSFNSIRGKDSDRVEETLDPIDSDKIASATLPPREKMRDDVRAAAEVKKASEANADLGVERTSPTLDLFATGSLYGRDPAFSESISKAYTTNNPYFVAGVRFSTPLDFGLYADVHDGYHQDKKAAELNLQRKLFEQESDWKDMSQKFTELKKRHTLALELEEAQKTKANFERDRLKRAKTTLYQVLMFEQDYANARLMRKKMEGEILSLVASLKTFGDTYESR